jgi:hypothetical protein
MNKHQVGNLFNDFQRIYQTTRCKGISHTVNFVF